jgi:4-hydroxybutyrate dehydrogenase / sulfolactaldehyde 3-reductase
MDTVGFIGLGRMGGGMAANLKRKGFDLAVHDINDGAVKRLTDLGARRANGAAGIAQASSLVVTMLPSSVEVEETILGADGILAHSKPGQLIMDMSTVDPQTTDKLAQAAAAKGVAVVDAPVGRLAWHADRGESLFMVGASDADFKRVEPLLKAMGTTIFHCGKVGTGIRTKLVNNLLAIALCELNAEALALSQRFELDLTKTLNVLYNTTATNGQLKVNWPNKVLSGDIEPGFTIDLAHKDLSLILAAANQAKVPMPMVAAAREMFSLARAGKHASADFSGMADALCEAAGIEKPRVPKGWKPPA